MMKLKRYSENGFLLTVLLLSLLLGCKKKKEDTVNPDFASLVVGTYPIYSYAVIHTETYSDTLKFPYNGMTGTFNVKRIDLTHVRTSYTLNSPASGLQGAYSGIYDTGDCELRNDTGIKNTFSIYVNNKKTGTVSPSRLIVTVPTQGAGATIIATR